MNVDKTNNLQLLGTIQNADESGIIVYAEQVYDKTGKKSVEERITDVETKATNAATAGVTSVKATGDDYINVTPAAASTGDVTIAVTAKDALKNIASTKQEKTLSANYSKATASSAIAKSTDTVEGALGKLEYKADKGISDAAAAQSTADANATKISNLQSSISGIKQFEYVIADHLPVPSASTMYKIYLVPSGTTTVGTPEPTATTPEPTATTPEPTATHNYKDEYITLEGTKSSDSSKYYYWEKLGTRDIDLSGYAKKGTTLSAYGITDAKIENGTITLGSNTITPLTSHQEALKDVKHGTDGSYVKLTVGAKDTNREQTLSVSESIQSVSDATSELKGLAEAYDVKDYVDTTCTEKDPANADEATAKGAGLAGVYQTRQFVLNQGYQTAAQVKATKVNNATNADTATTATTAGSATKATQDGNGNTIATTYLTKASGITYTSTSKTYTEAETTAIEAVLSA